VVRKSKIIIYIEESIYIMSDKEGLARATQKVVEKAGTEISYIVGNATEKSLEYADKIDQMSRGAVAIESGRALGSTAYKTAEDIARNDKVCAGACLVASACEVVAGTSAMIKYPGAMKVYFVAKTISVGCIRFRNLCKNAKGEITPC
jgi:hypothetical protein